MKKLVSEHLKDFIEENGFMMHKWNLIRINNRIIQNIYFEPSGWDKDSFTLNISIIPLFLPTDHAWGLGIGGSIGDVLGEADRWWILKDEKSTRKAFGEIRDFLENHALPWFAMTRSPDEILATIKKYPEYPWFRAGLGEHYFHYLGYIALDAGSFDEAKEYFQKYLDIFQGADDLLDIEIKSIEEVNKLLDSLDNPEKIRQILDDNTQKTAEGLGIKREEWGGEDK